MQKIFPHDLIQNEKHGLTKREHFATQILQGSGVTEYEDEDQRYIVREAVKLADILIEELNEDG